MNFTRPFWTRIGQALAYSFKGQIAIALLILAFLFSFGPAGFVFGWIAMAWLGLGYSRFLVNVLESVASGKQQPPPFGFDVLTDGLGLSIKHAVLIAIIASGAGYAWLNLNGVAAVVTAIAIVCAAPAGLMLLAFDYRFFDAANPVKWWRIAQTIGAAYWLLPAYLLVSGAIVGTLLGTAFSASLWLLPPVVFFALVIVTSSYFVLGAAMFQYRDAVGYEVVVDVDMECATPGPPVRTPADDVVAKADNLVRADRRDDAVKLLRDHLRRKSDPAVYERQLALLKDAGHSDEHQRLAAEYLNVLIHEQEWSRASALLRQCRGDNIQLRPANADAVFPLAQQLIRNSNIESAVEVLISFTAEHADHHDAPRGLLLLAETYTERLGRDQDALNFLSLFRQRYPGHPLTKDADALSRALSRISGQQDR